MIHNHEVRSSILRPATKLEALAFFASAFFVFVPPRKLCGVGLNVKSAQRKIPVDLHFIVRLRHKASGAALGLSCAACFVPLAGVFVSIPYTRPKANS